jgi:hypothetical protein
MRDDLLFAFALEQGVQALIIGSEARHFRICSAPLEGSSLPHWGDRRVTVSFRSTLCPSASTADLLIIVSAPRRY